MGRGAKVRFLMGSEGCGVNGFGFADVVGEKVGEDRDLFRDGLGISGGEEEEVLWAEVKKDELVEGRGRAVEGKETVEG